MSIKINKIENLVVELKKYRKKYKLSCSDIAYEINVHPATIYRFEKWESKTNIRDVIAIFNYLVQNHIKETLELRIEYKGK